MKNAYKGWVTKFVKNNKSQYSLDIKKWFKNGGSIQIGKTNIWTYINANGDAVLYVNGLIEFAKKYLHPKIKSIDIGKFYWRLCEKS